MVSPSITSALSTVKEDREVSLFRATTRLIEYVAVVSSSAVTSTVKTFKPG